MIDFGQLAVILRDRAEAEGGCTVNRAGEDLTGSGYVVGGKCVSKVGGNAADLAWWLGHVAPAGDYGSWKDSETGLIHYDAVDFVTDRDEAILVGCLRGEIAIWDSEAGAEIRMADVSPLGWREVPADPFAGCYDWSEEDEVRAAGGEPDADAGHYDESGY